MSGKAKPFKTLADAILLRNHVMERMERAEVESDSNVRRRELTFVVIGGGLVGVEVFGELTAFMDEVVRYYPRIRRDEIRLHLLEAGVRIMPEISEELSEYSARVLSRRAGVSIRTNSPVERIIVRLGLGPFPTAVESAKIQLNFLHCGVSVRDEGQANLIHWEQDLKGLTCSEDISRPKGAVAARVGTP